MRSCPSASPSGRARSWLVVGGLWFVAQYERGHVLGQLIAKSQAAGCVPSPRSTTTLRRNRFSDRPAAADVAHPIREPVDYECRHLEPPQ